MLPFFFRSRLRYAGDPLAIGSQLLGKAIGAAGLATLAMASLPVTAAATEVEPETELSLEELRKLNYAIDLNNESGALTEAGEIKEAEPLFAEAAKIFREIRGVKHPRTLTIMDNHASALSRLSRYSDSEQIYAEVLRIRKRVFGLNHPATLTSMNNYGLVLKELGRAAESETVLRQALVLKQSVLGKEHPSTLSTLNNLALTLKVRGRFVEAQQLYGQTLALMRRHLGEKHPSTIVTLGNYAGALRDLGRHVEAEPIYSEALRLNQETFGRRHPSTLTALNNYISVLKELGSLEKAHSMAVRTAAICWTYLGQRHEICLTASRNYAGILLDQGRISEAQPLLERELKLRREVLGPRHPGTLAAISSNGQLLSAIGRYRDAESLVEEALSLYRSELGAGHPGSLTSLANLAFVRLEQSARSHLALQPARSLVEEIRTARQTASPTPRQEVQLATKAQRETDHFELFANAAWARGPGLNRQARAAGAKSLSPSATAKLREEAMVALQDALAGSAGKAITDRIARRAAGQLEPLARERQELSQLWRSLDKAWVEALGESGGDVQTKRDNLRAEMMTIEKRIKAIDDRLRKEAPDYFALIRPSPLSLAAAQKLLAPDEVALMVVPTVYGTHSMLVSDEGVRWNRSDWTTAKVNEAVKRLLWDVGADVDASAVEGAEWGDEGSGVYPYAFDRAHALYKELVAPISAGLKGKRHVFVSASGSLTGLPFGILVSEIPEGENGDPDVLRSAKWFADAHSLIRIPTLQSLEFLRKYRRSDGKASNSPFLGFGDPVLMGAKRTRAARRSVRSAGPTGGAFDGLFRGERDRRGANVVNLVELRKLSRLPGTALELKAMWEAFGRPPNALYLAEDATEDRIRTRNLDANIINFATHGLLAGEISGAAEPGLVFTPPAKASESNDGYLSTSEITALKLNADWVILSACNTAAGDGKEGAPGLSGLARSFFYAGARNLLASHWLVRDDVAAKLTVRTISIAQENPGLSRAQAFGQAMREIRNDTIADGAQDTWAHPSAWAPFSLIGDGARLAGGT